MTSLATKSNPKTKYAIKMAGAAAKAKGPQGRFLDTIYSGCTVQECNRAGDKVIKVLKEFVPKVPGIVTNGSIVRLKHLCSLKSLNCIDASNQNSIRYLEMGLFFH